MEFTGWRLQDEEKDFADYSGLCKGSVLEWKDVETQIALEAKMPFTRSIDDVVNRLHLLGKSSYNE